MIFGTVPLDQAAGAVLAHSVKLDSGRLRKGKLLDGDDVAKLRAAGLEEVIAARFEPGDVGENEAARRIAAALVRDPAAAGLTVSEPFTGRVNLLAGGPGVVVLDEAVVGAVNRIDPMITLATVAQHQQMAPGGMVATIKIISYGVAGDAVARAEAAAGGEALRLAPPRCATAGLAMTVIPGGPNNAKGRKAIEGRVRALGLEMAEVVEVPHEAGALGAALARLQGDLLLILTASATSDPADVAPTALRDAGGRVDRFGMPVDPGNLLFLGALDGRPVIGLPGCARSPALNGADWVLSRVVCGLKVTGEDIADMGVGGLLKEIPTRPQPRAGKAAKG
ncbi:molybdopterin-binding protein [Marinibacterium profundimaris]|uniref:Molybdopterin biosynthesis protein n=1 Tax=Marinibacterium profundimaris TaxID=1679460 RepID=A0A225NUA4_9RHOB|nr:molybdopterin-binding protein [Marinibacterium profundimaris]OWU77850.1 molybdopterin biosynthesis protein [Marinibacterium profundimaris]